MEKAIFLHAFYEKSDTITIQGNRASIECHLRDGYRKVDERNGFWILNRPARAMVYLADSKGEQYLFNMKESILNHYSRKMISQKLLDRFSDDAKAGRISFYLDGDGNYYMR